MDYSVAKFWLEVAIVIINLGLWLFIWNSNRNKVTKQQLEAHAVQLAEINIRLTQAIGHPELEPLHRRMNNMDKNLSEIKGQMHTLDLIHELLLKRGE